MMTMIDEIKWSRWTKDVAAGVDVSEVLSSAIDCMGMGRALVSLELGAVVDLAVLNLAVYECETASGTYTEIGGLGDDGIVITGYSDKSILLDLPLSKRYVKVGYKRTVQNTVIDSGIIAAYNGKKIPEDQPADVKKAVVL